MQHLAENLRNNLKIFGLALKIQHTLVGRRMYCKDEGYRLCAITKSSHLRHIHAYIITFQHYKIRNKTFCEQKLIPLSLVKNESARF